MKKFLLLFVGLGFLVISCDKNDDDITGPNIPDGPGNVTLDNEINEFIWRGMNYWYFWQADQEDLADDRFNDTDEFYSYLNGFNSPEDLFDDLVFQPGVTDDFSRYIEDVDEQLNSFRGIRESYGISFPRPAVVQLNESSDDVVVIIGYVVPGSPAANAGLKRGDLIYKVDGVQLTVDNFSAINNIFINPNITLEIAEIENGELVPTSGEFAMSPILLTENPVHYFDVIEEGNKKIGYLVYNSFRDTFNGELNEVFGFFKNQGIDELILDMRYNGGGRVLTASYLASMIDGNITANSDTFTRLQYNDKRDASRGNVFTFSDEALLFNKTTGDRQGQEDINRLTTLNKLFVLGTNRTASASELIINGLRPYMDVILVGETTVGKNEGSITVVDSNSPFTSLDGRNKNHTVGIQPIVFQSFNSLEQSDYTFGFQPDIPVREIEFVDNILPFGDTNEPLLRAALNRINGVSSKNQIRPTMNVPTMRSFDGIKFPKFTDEMYLMDAEIELIQN